MVYVSDPELVRFVTVKNPDKFERTNFVSLIVPSVSKGLFAVVGKAHARQKRIIGPAFSSANLKGFLSIFQENSKNLVKVRNKITSGNVMIITQNVALFFFSCCK